MDKPNSNINLQYIKGKIIIIKNKQVIKTLMSIFTI